MKLLQTLFAGGSRGDAAPPGKVLSVDCFASFLWYREYSGSDHAVNNEDIRAFLKKELRTYRELTFPVRKDKE